MFGLGEPGVYNVSMAGVPVSQSPVAPWLDRVIAALLVVAAAIAIWLLATMVPDSRGHGTHEQLGMEPCGWAVHWGLPCPTCGVTTAACYLVHFSPWQAVKVQPFGTFVALAGLLLAVSGLLHLITGRSFMFRLAMLPYGTITSCTVLLLLGSWLYKYLTFTT